MDLMVLRSGAGLRDRSEPFDLQYTRHHDTDGRMRMQSCRVPDDPGERSPARLGHCGCGNPSSSASSGQDR